MDLLPNTMLLVLVLSAAGGAGVPDGAAQLMAPGGPRTAEGPVMVPRPPSARPGHLERGRDMMKQGHTPTGAFKPSWTPETHGEIDAHGDKLELRNVGNR